MTYRTPRSVYLGYCNSRGLGVTDKSYTPEEAFRMVAVLNERARRDAERGVGPNTVYWIHNAKEKKIES